MGGEKKKKKKRTFGVSSQSRLKEKYKDIYLLPLGEEKSPSSLLVPRRKETAGGRGWEEVGGKEISVEFVGTGVQLKSG